MIIIAVYPENRQTHTIIGQAAGRDSVKALSACSIQAERNRKMRKGQVNKWD
jgi:hypothetical protein